MASITPLALENAHDSRSSESTHQGCRLIRGKSCVSGVMVRRQRCDHPGALHHVMNRGLARRTIFHDDSDRRYFLSRVAREVRRGTLEVFAYCLLCNHFHLLVASPAGCLSEAMMRIQNRHVRRFNRKCARDGPLFRGRFHSLPIEDDTHWQLLFDYIHLNPVDAGMVSRAADYPFSSARYFAGAHCPPWLTLPFDKVSSEVLEDSPHAEHDPSCVLSAEERWIAERLLDAEGGVRAHAHLPDSLDSGMGQWMVDQAVLADGPGPIPPCAAPATLLGIIESLKHQDPDWIVAPNRRAKSGWGVLTIGLLRSLAGLSYVEMAALLRLPAGTLRLGILDHRKCLADNETYRLRAAAIAREALSWTEAKR